MYFRKRNNLIDWLLGVYLLIWTVVNSLILQVFPAVHSDEAWLAGLAKSYLDTGSVTVTEPFFDLFPRQPHAFKMLFHLLQAGFIRLLGFDLLAVRLLSLVAAGLTLIFVYNGLSLQTRHKNLAAGLTVALSLQPLFLTTAHLARQESLIVAVLAFTFWIVPTIKKNHQGIGLGVVLGLAALIHPNALFPAATAGLILLKETLARRIKAKTLLSYGVGLMLSGVALLGISLAVSPEFLANYAEFGANMQVTAAPSQRWSNFGHFFRQIWLRDTGTYGLPELRYLLAAIPILVILARIGMLLGRSKADLNASSAVRMILGNGLLGLFAFGLVLYVIGRFNPTSIAFCLMPMVWVVAGILGWTIDEGPFRLPRTRRTAPAVLIALLIVSNTYSAWQEITPIVLPVIQTGQDPYQVYSRKIAESLPEQAKVLGNLSAGFVLQERAAAFYDIRNLAYVGEGDPSGENDRSVSDYLARHGIDTVIWYEEYDFILRNPEWWVLYEIRPDRTTDPSALRELRAILDERGVLLDRFEAPIYGTRVVRFQGDYPWSVSLYRLDPAASAEMPPSQ